MRGPKAMAKNASNASCERSARVGLSDLGGEEAA
jgi:hypothetical protein